MVQAFKVPAQVNQALRQIHLPNSFLVAMVKENTLNEPITNFHELFNTLVASQAKLHEEFNTLSQKLKGKDTTTFQNAKVQGPQLTESEKKLKEHLDQMEQLFQKFQWKEDAMNFHSLSLFPQVRAPPKFKMPSLDKFDRTGYPKAHLKMYIRALQPLGATEELLAQMFQNTLTVAALR